MAGLHCPNTPGPFHLLLLLIVVVSIRGQAVEPQIFDNITANGRYDIRVRPDADSGKPVTVVTNAYVYFIGSIDAQNLEFTAQILVRHSWHDPRLRFDWLTNSTGQLEGEEWLRKKVWVPSVYFVNERERVMEENVFVAIQPNGTVQYNYRVKLRIFCAMSLQKFPFDKQRCTLIMESWMYSVSDLLLEWTVENPVQVNSQVNLPEYKLIRTSTNASINTYPKSAPNFGIDYNELRRQEGKFSALLIHFDFEREVGHYIMDYYVPSILLVVMSWVSFWLDPNAVPGRTTLGTSTMLTFITLTRNTGSSLPKVSYIKAVEIWFIVCAAFIFGSLVEFAFVNSIWRRRKNVQLKKVNSKYILKSTLTPKMSRKTYSSEKTASNGDLHSLSCSFDQTSSPSSQQLTVTSLDSALSVSNCRLSVASCSDLEGETVVSLAVPGCQSAGSSDSVDGGQQQLPPNKSFFTMTPQEIAAWIDRRSRVLFPAGFVLFNILYWSMVWL